MTQPQEITYRIAVPPAFHLARTLTCGQAFRWSEDADGIFTGVVADRVVRVRQADGALQFFGSTKSDFDTLLRTYFDFDRDYKRITDAYCADPHLQTAVTQCAGIRILHQAPWETLCSFILSQNNNIPRIRGIVSRLCADFGEPLAEGFFAFPSPQALAERSLADLAPLRAGFRAKYILDAAQKVASGEVDFAQITAREEDFGRAQLQKIKGVGAKVAECTLLYGFGKLDAFPRDVWVNRVMAELYPGGLPACTDGTRGIAQQYLFHWRRTCATAKPSEGAL